MIKRKWYSYNMPILTVEKLRLSHWLFLIFWLLKPFYIFPSGSVQPSDMIFFLSFLVWLAEERGNLSIDRGNQYFAYFVFSIFVVNTIYSVIYKDTIFLEKSMFYFYSLLIVIVFPCFAENKKFLKYIFLITMINIIIQLIVFSLNLGRRLFGGIRYMGTFNDPNQFSFFLFASFLLLYLLMYYFRMESDSSKNARLYFFFAIVVFLIFQGSSTGAFLGIVAFIAALMLSFVTLDRSPMRMVMKLVIFALIIAALAFVIILIVAPEVFDIQGREKNFLIQRLLEKLGKVSSGGLFAIVEERQVSRAFLFPINLIYGAGEGLYDRFVKTEPLEIHSTIIALWFYYGIIPISFLFLWIKNKVAGLPHMLHPVFWGLLFESLILANQRQPILWMLLILGDLIAHPQGDKESYGLLRKI